MPQGEHLTAKRIARIREIHAANPWMTDAQIGRRLRLSGETIGKYRPETEEILNGAFSSADLALTADYRRKQQILRWQRENPAFNRAVHKIRGCRWWQRGKGVIVGAPDFHPALRLIEERGQ